MDETQLFPFQKLDSYKVALELVEIVARAGIRHTELRDQAERASTSTFLRLSEGLPNEGAKMRRKYFVESNNSLHELVAAMHAALVLKVVAPEVTGEVQRLGLRLRRMLRGLMR